MSHSDYEHVFNKLDRWVDVLKDSSLVIAGFIGSYLALVSKEQLGQVLAILVVTISVVALVFLPYKVASTKVGKLGIFSRVRALSLMAIIAVSWSILLCLVLFIPGSVSSIRPFETSNQMGGLLIIIIVLVPILGDFFQVFVARPLLIRLGLSEEFWEKTKKYPWYNETEQMGAISLLIYICFAWLLEAQYSSSVSYDFAVIMYPSALASLVLLGIVGSSWIYFKPERGGWKSVVLAMLEYFGAFLAVFTLGAGLIIALTFFVAHTIYTQRQAEPSIEEVAEQRTRKEEKSKRINEYIERKHPRLYFGLRFLGYVGISMILIYLIIYYLLSLDDFVWLTYLGGSFVIIAFLILNRLFVRYEEVASQ